jgi:hypothetical protein
MNSQNAPTRDPDAAMKMAMAWHELQQRRMREGQTVDWASMADDEELKDPKNLKVEFGPVLTEEQFKAHLKATGVTNPKIVRTSKK